GPRRPGAPAPPPPAPRGGARGGRGVRRALRVVCVGGLAGAAVLVWWPQPRSAAPAAPAHGPGARAVSAVEGGAPATTTELTALVVERERHLRAHPGDHASWALLGTAYVERGRRTGDSADLPRAERALNASLAARPEGNAGASTGLARLAAARGDHPAARAWAQRAVRLAPRRWQGYPPLIEAHRGLGDFAAAGTALDSLRELRVPAAVTRTVTGALYRERGWREDAAANLTDAVAAARTPAEEARARHLLGGVAADRGEAETALGHFDAALRADPGLHEALAGRGRALAALGRDTEAVHALRTASARRPVPEYALELGELHEAAGAADAARAQYRLARERLRARAAHGVRDVLVRARLAADHGDAAEREAVAEELAAEAGRAPRPAVSDARGWVLFRQGDAEGALEWVREAQDRGPRVPLVAYHRGEIERELGRTARARRHLADALRWNPGFSPLFAPRARTALAGLGSPAPGGPARTHGPAEPLTSPSPSPSPSRTA
ncbi:tetratricopeptide repeat protein, partial [Streptomyces sp. NPDC002490]|uniref:tetratricopeptide repeat protein n=1 Tax=Streptomyces sp. NPDC002490 TaxID=3154416 RepID=UPI00331AEB7A